MTTDTQGAAIVGNGFVAFADSLPDLCKHDNNGPVFSVDEAGQYFNQSEIPSYNDDYEAWNAFHKTHRIIGSARPPAPSAARPFTSLKRP